MPIKVGAPTLEMSTFIVEKMGLMTRMIAIDKTVAATATRVMLMVSTLLIQI